MKIVCFQKELVVRSESVGTIPKDCQTNIRRYTERVAPLIMDQDSSAVGFFIVIVEYFWRRPLRRLHFVSSSFSGVPTRIPESSIRRWLWKHRGEHQIPERSPLAKGSRTLSTSKFMSTYASVLKFASLRFGEKVFHIFFLEVMLYTAWWR